MTGYPSRRRYLSLWLPYLSADRLRLENPPVPGAGQQRPLVFIEKVKGVSRIAATDAAANGCGLAFGMTLADARARIPSLATVALDRSADRAFLVRLAGICLAFTPSIADDALDGLVLDITGCAHLFAGEAGLVARLQAALRNAGVSLADIAVAPTPDMARALARFGRGHPIIAQDDQPVRALPVAALECGPEDAGALKRAGLRTIGDIAGRPSILFSARFTERFTTKLARILGEEDRRIAPLRARPAYVYDHKCPEPAVSAEVIIHILEKLVHRAALQLEKSGEGGRVFEAVFFRTDGVIRRIRIETSQATRDSAIVLHLYRDRLDVLADPLDPGFGFDVIRLHIVRTEPFDTRQESFDARDGREEQMAGLIDRLGAIFGNECLVRLLPVNSHVPEQAQTTAPASQLRTRGDWQDNKHETSLARPHHLFEPPHRIEMQTGTAGGDPKRFRWRRMVHEIMRTEGPERIAEEWWLAPTGYGTRDYYRVETLDGHRFWIFRAGAPAPTSAPAARWFLHGVFA